MKNIKYHFYIETSYNATAPVGEFLGGRWLAEMIAQIKEEATSIAGAVAELEKLIGEVEE